MTQLSKIHLGRLLYLFLEILRILVQLFECCNFKGAEVLNRIASEAARPALFKDPLVEIFFPVNPGRIDALLDLE